MSNILTYVRVVVATSDVQSILELPATDEIHIEDRNHGLAWTKPKSGMKMQHAKHSTDLQVNSDIKLQLDQIAAKNIIISLDKCMAFPK